MAGSLRQGEAMTADLLDAIAEALCPDPADPRPRHTEASGASLAVTVAALRRVGFAWPGALAARAFYGTIAVAAFVGALLNLTKLEPIKPLFWSAVINGGPPCLSW